MPCYYASEINKRPSNEDSFCSMEIRVNHEAAVYAMAVADGMGGMTGGKFYSDLAVKLWFGQLQQGLMGLGFLGRSLEDQMDFLRAFSKKVYETIGKLTYKQGLDKGYHGGTTLATVLHYWDTWFISNCGDSPIYAFKDGRLRLVSELHNVAGQMVRDGKTQPGSLAYHMNKNLLTAYLGGKDSTDPYVTVIPDSDADLFLFGSDGAFGDLTADEIGDVIRQAENPKKIIPDLFARTRLDGETDNQTAIVCLNMGGRPERNRPAGEPQPAGGTASDRESLPGGENRVTSSEAEDPVYAAAGESESHFLGRFKRLFH